MTQQNTDKPFAYGPWAVLIAIGGIQQVVLPYLVKGTIEFPPVFYVFSVITGVAAIAAAVGIWMKRRWGLWLYLALLVTVYANVILQAFIEKSQTGEIRYLGMRVGTLIIGALFLRFFYSQRDKFE
jgi:hypothetical protein